jgi:hypothetical protein
MAAGTITACAATAQAAVNIIPWPGFPRASFCATSPSIEPLARWKKAPQTAKIISGRLASSVLQGEGRVPWPAPSGSRPRATSWSMEPRGTIHTAITLAMAVTPIIQNTTGVPRKGAVSRITTLMTPLPRWNRASLRPAR